MSKKQKECPVCNEKIGLLSHEFESGIRICSKCLSAANLSFSELSERGQKNIPIDEIMERVRKTKETKGLCAVCKSELTFFKTKRLSDSNICSSCLNSAELTFNELTNIHKIKLSQILPRINGDVKNFEPNKTIGKYVKFSDKNKQMLIMPGEIIDYDSLISYELLQDGDTIASGGLGRAFVGGALFGGTGAVVGAVTGNRKGNCDKLQIKITIKSDERSSTYITFIDKKTKKKSTTYKKAFDYAQECLSTLEIICKNIKEQEQNKPIGSSAEEIMKYKELLDIGAITEEEYNLKKEQLLGL